MNRSAGSLPPMFLFTPSIVCFANTHKEVASKEATKVLADHAKARLRWALAHKDWTAEDFRG